MERILITPRSLTSSPAQAVDMLNQHGFEVVLSTPGKIPDEAELLKLVPNVVGWLAGVEPISEKVIRAATNLKVISRNGSGVDNLPAKTVAERGIVVRRADGSNAQGVAELTIALIFASLRHIPFSDAGLKAGGWIRKRGIEIRGRSIGVVGCGAIGREVARLAASLGAQILAFDPAQPDLGIDKLSYRWVDLPNLIAGADIITLHCPPTRGGVPLVGLAELKSMKAGSILVNTARASLVDELAIVQALELGLLSTYATDVFPQEPPDSLHLYGRPDVIATSHIGGFTDESVDRATTIAVNNLIQVLRP